MTGAQRRRQLLDVGRELFAEKGYEATSIEEIAARADVSKPVVYEHFGGKEGLYAVVVDREMQRLLDRFTSALSAPGHPRELLERAALVLLEYIEEDTDGFRVLTRDAPVTSGAGGFSSLIGEVARKVEHILGRPVRRARLRPASSPSSTARRWSAWSRWSASGGWTPARRASTRWPRTWSTWPTTAWPTSSRDPGLVDRPCAGAEPAQPTRRAPGTGPCTARTVRKTPAPASSAASRTAAVLVLGQRRHGRARSR